MGDVVTATDLVGLFVDLGALLVFDEMKHALDAEMVSEVVIKVGCPTINSVGKVVRAGSRKAPSNLKVGGARGCRSGLSMHYRCDTSQADEDEDFFEQLHLPKLFNAPGVLRKY